MEKKFYHFYANGDDAKNFIISERDFIFEFNLVGICAYEKGVIVVSFSVEDSHPHGLLYGTEKDCESYKIQFETSSLRHIAATRGSCDNVTLKCELSLVDDEDYLKNVGTYSIVQPTKDGKPIMFYDYKWGTGSMYFRPEGNIPIWQLGPDGSLLPAVRYGDLPARERRRICGRHTIPEDWLVCNGIILPNNYVDVRRFEQIYRTFNCYRAFCGAGNKQLAVVQERMAVARGVLMDDMEARGKCKEVADELFDGRDPRRMSVDQRLGLARALRQRDRLSFRQLSTLVRLPESEIVKYIS